MTGRNMDDLYIVTKKTDSTCQESRFWGQIRAHQGRPVAVTTALLPQAFLPALGCLRLP